MEDNTSEIWRAHHAAHAQVWAALATDENNKLYSAMLKDWCDTLKTGGTIYFIGNGGSSVDACHIAAELSGRYERERRPLRAMSLTANLAHITAVGNDYGYDQVFERICKAVLNKNDVLVGISTSGNSVNVLKACEVARIVGCRIHAWTGAGGGKLKEAADLTFVAPTKKTSVIQESYLAWGHALCGGIDSQFA